jgi:hypothetical protein
MVSDILSGDLTAEIPNELNISLLSALAAATNRNAAPKSLEIFLSAFILPLFRLIT